MADTLLTEFPPVHSADWKRKIMEELKGKPFEELIWHTKEGFDVLPFYTAGDTGKIKVSVPQKQRAGWEIRQDFVVKDVKKANTEALQALASGAEGIGVDVSKTDITKTNLQRLLKGIDTKKNAIHFSGVKIKSLEKLVSVFASKASGSVRFGDFSVQHLPALAKYAAKFPGVDFIVLSTTADTATGQIAELIKSGITILQQCAASKIPLKKILPTIRFIVPLSADYFMEIAKLRALRLLWTKKVNEFERVKDVPVFIHAENALLPAAEGAEHSNILRATTGAMAAIAGGGDSLYLKPAALQGKSKAFSERIYRNIQLLLKHESGFQELGDFGAGSFYIDSLTNQIAQQVGKQ